MAKDARILPNQLLGHMETGPRFKFTEADYRTCGSRIGKYRFIADVFMYEYMHRIFLLFYNAFW